MYVDEAQRAVAGKEKCLARGQQRRSVSFKAVFTDSEQEGHLHILSVCYPLQDVLRASRAGSLTDWETEAECLANTWKDISEAAEAGSGPPRFSLPVQIP